MPWSAHLWDRRQIVQKDHCPPKHEKSEGKERERVIFLLHQEKRNNKQILTPWLSTNYVFNLLVCCLNNVSVGSIINDQVQIHSAQLEQHVWILATSHCCISSGHLVGILWPQITLAKLGQVTWPDILQSVSWIPRMETWVCQGQWLPADPSTRQTSASEWHHYLSTPWVSDNKKELNQSTQNHPSLVVS